jgi:hypothetical protein
MLGRNINMPIVKASIRNTRVEKNSRAADYPSPLYIAEFGVQSKKHI